MLEHEQKPQALCVADLAVRKACHTGVQTQIVATPQFARVAKLLHGLYYASPVSSYIKC